MSDLPTIPDFVNTTDSMGNSLRAVKQIVDRLAGNTQGASLGAPNMFVQTAEPRNGANISLKKGDLWIRPEAGDNPAKMFYWNSNIWKKLI